MTDHHGKGTGKGEDENRIPSIRGIIIETGTAGHLRKEEVIKAQRTQDQVMIPETAGPLPTSELRRTGHLEIK